MTILNTRKPINTERQFAHDFGALVISLDFELHWGVRDTHGVQSSYRKNLLGVRQAIPRILDLFERFGVAATWATVGFLFAASRKELEHFSPSDRPQYKNTALFPYNEPIGEREEDDLLHFAPSLIAEIAKRPHQEIGTHTFSHYYCLEQGQTQETFKADLESACAIAYKYGIPLRSIVFPRNQFNPLYTDVLMKAGIICYRGNEQGRINQASTTKESKRILWRGGRLINRYMPVSTPSLTSWNTVLLSNNLCNIPASCFLAPYTPRLKYLEPLRIARIAHGIRAAAVSGKIYHLWWHPHNFGAYTDENIAILEQILEVFADVRATHGMRSWTMADVAVAARETYHSSDKQS